MRFYFSRILSLLGLVLLLSSCDQQSYNKILKSSDVNLKLQKANEYYDRKSYRKANELYHSLIPVFRGTKNWEALLYRYCWSYYNMGDYLNAGYNFKNFTEFFPNSPDAEECEYMYTICLFKETNKASLEQTNTIKAMEAMQEFINNHPQSKRIADINRLIDEGRRKLEEKEALAARLYYNIGQYKAAAISYKDVIRQYPESDKADYYYYMIVRSTYRYALASVESKQAERFAQVTEAYQELRSNYPNSSWLKDGEKFVSLSAENLRKLSNK